MPVNDPLGSMRRLVLARLHLTHEQRNHEQKRGPDQDGFGRREQRSLVFHGNFILQSAILCNVKLLDFGSLSDDETFDSVRSSLSPAFHFAQDSRGKSKAPVVIRGWILPVSTPSIKANYSKAEI